MHDFKKNLKLHLSKTHLTIPLRCLRFLDHHAEPSGRLPAAVHIDELIDRFGSVTMLEDISC